VSTSQLIPAVFTPMDPRGAIDLARIEAQAAVFAARGLRRVFVCGTTGEWPSLTTEERMQVVEAWCAAGSELDVIAHVGHTSLPEAERLAAHAERAGAAGIAAVAPFYFRPDSAVEAVEFCARAAGTAPDTPFFYYHIPSMTGAAFSAVDFLARSLERIPTLAGIKFTDHDLDAFMACGELAGDRLELLFGCDEILVAGLAAGATGAVGSTYGFAAPIYQRLLAAFASGDLATARGHQRIARQGIAVAQSYGAIPAFKAIMEWVGLPSGPCRPPLRSLSRGEREALRAELDALGYLEAIRAG
jgi:N-acetylneuraminate lyase